MNSTIDPEKAIREAALAQPDAARAAAERFAARAAQEDLADIAYACVDAPIGKVLVAATERGIVKLSLPTYSPEEALEQLAEKISPRMLELPARLDDARRQLDRYFEGRLHRFELPLDWRLGGEGFRARALRAIERIPYGETRTYTEIAAEAGSPRAVRAAGSACGFNPIPIIVPCHRVLRSGGQLGNYGGGPEMKETLLKLEGVL